MPELFGYLTSALGATFSSSQSFVSEIISFIIKMYLASQMGTILEVVIIQRTKHKSIRFVIFVVLTILSVYLYGSFYDHFRKPYNYFQ